MINRFRGITTQLALFATIYLGAASSQESRAVISGTVTDPQGAVVPLAIVEVRNLETNVTSKTLTNDRGLYSVPPLNPGRRLNRLWPPDRWI